MKPFVGRHDELEKLEDLFLAPRPILTVIKGRRRIGKSRLAMEFGKKRSLISFSGLAPNEELTAQDQRNHFARQFYSQFGIPPLTFEDWSDAFAHLTQQLTQQPTVVLLDEISWMGSEDATFIPKLKVWWDETLQDYPNLMLILCGSISTWIDTNIINSTAFFGRISLQIDLEPLSIAESYSCLDKLGIHYSDYDTFKTLSVTGGIPWYLEQINPRYTADENIKRICFQKNGALVGEFTRIFHELFGQRGELYKRIIQALAEGMKTLAQLRNELGYAHAGSFSKYLENLHTSGFISRHYTWSLKTGALGRQSLYRLCDNYLRFYVKYIEPELPRIEKGSFKDMPMTGLAGWETMMGFQVENLLLQNRSLLLKALGIYPQDVVADNPYIQKATHDRRGCQIDYLIHTRTNTLFVCESKFRKKELNVSIIDQMQNKIHRLAKPRGYGICPVLIHLGGVTDEVYDRRYFYRVIDIADFLKAEF
ncbi:MAG: ATP-binding protein [Pseudomonadota bacterium]